MIVKKIIIGAFILGIVILTPSYSDISRVVKQIKEEKVLVIDPGHGGIDPGAVSEAGTAEKNINLAIAKALEEEGKKAGYKVILTRTTDEGLYEEGKEEWTKGGDIRERQKIILESKANLAILIHLNSYKADKSVRGAQVFYPKGGEESLRDENKAVAEEVQKSLIETLKDGSERVAMEKGDIYLFEKSEGHIILVECGFLSNPEDESNLKKESYAKKLAKAIIEGVKRTNI